jgi:hypothetical protein
MIIQLLDCWFNDKNPTFPDIGSFNPINLSNLARLISETLGNGNVVALDNSQLPSSYVPDLFTPNLNHQYISLENTIERWAAWLDL